MKHFVNCRSLQLFAQEAAAPESGVTEADAQPQTESAAGDPAEFEKLITGPYKQAYDARVQNIIQQRLKNAKETTEKFRALEPIAQMLSRHYGVEDGDYSALEESVRKAFAPPDPAEQQRQQAEIQAGASRMVEQWNLQAREIQETYPAFDLRQEMGDERFVQLLRSHVDMRTAYEILHKDEIIPAAMAYAAKTVERKLADSLRSSGSRPSENGAAVTGPMRLGSRVEQMSRKEIADLCRRVERGKKISFG